MNMIISLLECSAVVEEVKPVLTGGVIQKIHQPQPFSLTLDIRVPGESFSLLICSEPKYARLHLATIKLDNPLTPYPFCQYLRSHIEGGRIESIEQEPEDRIVYFNILKSSSKYVLVVALTGNQSNVYVLDEADVILRLMKPSRLEVGDTFKPPERPSAAVKPAPSPSPPPLHGGEGNRLLGQGEQREEFIVRFPVSTELEKRCREQQESQSRLEWFKARTAQVRKALKQAIRRKHTLEADLAKAEKYREYQRYGELLKSQLHVLKPRQAIVEVVDYYDPALPTLSLPLNELKDPVWNMEDYFRKYRKFLSAQEHLRPRLEKTQKDIESFKMDLAKLEKEELEEIVELPGSIKSENPIGVSSPTLPSPSERMGLNPRGGKKQLPSAPLHHFVKEQRGKAKPQTKHYRTFESFDGLAILVGKSAKDNDYLTLKVAKPDDLWLHARGCPGSHVVVRLDKGTDVPHETLRDAATLALFYSDLKKSGKGEVIYTLKKFVKKSKGLKSGAVHVSREKSIWIELKKDRLHRLKGEM